MKIWLDENIPARLALELKQLGHEVEAVAEGPLQGCSDPEVWQAAQDQGAFFVTQDLDFSDALRAYSLVRIHNHPSGNLRPSEADFGQARFLQTAGGMLGVELRDFVIVAESGWYSFHEKVWK